MTRTRSAVRRRARHLVVLIAVDRRSSLRAPALRNVPLDFVGGADHRLVVLSDARPSVLYLQLVDHDEAYFVALRVSGQLQLRRRRQFVKLKAQLLAEEILGDYDLGVGHV